MPQRHLLGAFGEHPLTALRLPAAVAALAPDRLQRPMSHWQILDPRLAHVERAPAHQHPAPRSFADQEIPRLHRGVATDYTEALTQAGASLRQAVRTSNACEALVFFT